MAAFKPGSTVLVSNTAWADPALLHQARLALLPIRFLLKRGKRPKTKAVVQDWFFLSGKEKEKSPR